MFILVSYDVLNGFKCMINTEASLINFYEIIKFIYCYFCDFTFSLKIPPAEQVV